MIRRPHTWRKGKSFLSALAFAVIVGAPAGCIIPGAALELPSQGGHGWQVFRSKHFTVSTDLNADEARRLSASFEHTYNLLASAIFPGASAPDFQTNVICFRSLAEFREFVPDPFGGRYMRRLSNDLELVPTITMFGSFSPWVQNTLAHELVHRFNYVALGSMSPWLNEGLAQYYSTVWGDVDNPIVGEMDPEQGLASGSSWARGSDEVIFQGHVLAIGQLPKASELMKMDDQTFYVRSELGKNASFDVRETSARQYATAWGLVHMLMKGKSTYAERFQRALGGHTPGDRFADALKTAFAEIDAKDLDRTLDVYLRTPIFWRQHHDKAAPIPEDLVQSPLGESQILTLWARLDPWKGPRAGRAKRRLDQALAAAPDDAETHFWLGRYAMLEPDSRRAENHFKLAVASAPENAAFAMGLGLLYLGDTQTWPANERKALARAAMEKLAHSARTATELDMLAVFHALDNHLDQAEGFSGKACELDPSYWQCLHNRAFVSFRKGDLHRALTLESMAMERLPEGAGPKDVAHLRQALREYQAATENPSTAKRAKVMPIIPE